MPQNMEAARWLGRARAALEPPALPPQYASMQAVREKGAELERLRTQFVRRATDFLRTYLASLADPLLANRASFAQRANLKLPDHAELRYRCRTYAPLLQLLKVTPGPQAGAPEPRAGQPQAGTWPCFTASSGSFSPDMSRPFSGWPPLASAPL